MYWERRNLEGICPKARSRQDFGHPLCVSLTYAQIKITTKNNLGKISKIERLTPGLLLASQMYGNGMGPYCKNGYRK